MGTGVHGVGFSSIIFTGSVSVVNMVHSSQIRIGFPLSLIPSLFIHRLFQAVAALSFLSPSQYTGNLSLSVSCRDVYVTTKLDIDMNIASSNSTHLMLDVVHDVEIFEDELIRINDFFVDFGLLVNILFFFN
jgi:hypothetical protein